MVAIRPGAGAQLRRERAIAAIAVTVKAGARRSGDVGRRHKPLDRPEIPGRVFSGWSNKAHLSVLLRLSMLWRQSVSFPFFMPHMHDSAAGLALILRVRDTLDAGERFKLARAIPWQYFYHFVISSLTFLHLCQQI